MARGMGVVNKMCDPPWAREDCTPGCPNGHDDARWCRRRDEDQCGWLPTQLDQMLVQQWEKHKPLCAFNPQPHHATAWVQAC
jgi:hypothetical protein